MTSKISSAKLFKESIKRSSAIGALMTLVYFCIFPITGMAIMEGYRRAEFRRTDILDTLREFLAFDMPVLVVTMIFAAVMGILQFAYLHSKEKMDFYHSFPVRRERYFCINYLSGAVQWTFAYAVNLLLALWMVTVEGYADGQLWLQAWQGMVIQLLSFLLIYSCMVLVMMVTGKIFAAVLGMGVACVYFPAVLFLQEGMHEAYFTTYLHWENIGADYLRLSPVYVCLDLMKRFASSEYSSRDLGLGVFLTVFLAVGLCVYLYRLRGSESAGHTVVFSGIARVFKFLIVVPLSLMGNLIFYAIGQNVFWGFFGLVFGFVLSTAIVEFIYRMDIREVFADKRQILLAFTVTFCILIFYQFDLSSFDKKLPAQSAVESVEFNQYGTGYYGPYASALGRYTLLPASEGSFVYQLEGYVEKEGYKVQDLDAVYNLLEQRMDRSETQQNQEKVGICVTYHMKDGTEKERRYSFPEEVLIEYFEPIWSDEGYKQHSIPVLAIDNSQVLDLSVGSDMEYQGYALAEKDQISEYVDPDAEELGEKYAEEIDVERRLGERIEFNREQEEGLFATLCKELKEVTLNELWKACSDGNMLVLTVVYLSDNGEVYGDSFYLSDAFPKTRALLEEWGYNLSWTDEAYLP